MNSTLNNSTLVGYSFKVLVLLDLVKSSFTILFLLSVSLNSYIIFLLLSKGGLEVSVVFLLSNSVAEILMSTLTLLYIVLIDDKSVFVVKLVDFLFGVSMSARLLFLCCVCLERYLAVVHPLVFLKLKPLRYRVSCSVLVWSWTLTLGVLGCTLISAYSLLVAVNIMVLLVVFFCCVSVLRKLKRPGPGDMEREQREMNATKKKAIQIISISLLTCLIQNAPIAVSYSLEKILSFYDFSVVTTVFTILNMVVGFIQPLFILHNSGKLSFRCS